MRQIKYVIVHTHDSRGNMVVMYWNEKKKLVPRITDATYYDEPPDKEIVKVMDTHKGIFQVEKIYVSK